jgi:hypothetical protein
MCMGHRARPLIHQVHNAGTGEMRLIGAEIKASPPVTSPDPLHAPGHTLALERERLRVYELTLDPGESTGEVDYRFASLTVFLTIATLRIRSADGSERTVVQSPADVAWSPGPSAVEITNVGEQPWRAFVGEWR